MLDVSVLVLQYVVQVLAARLVHFTHVRPDDTSQLVNCDAFVDLGLVQVNETYITTIIIIIIVVVIVIVKVIIINILFTTSNDG